MAKGWAPGNERAGGRADNPAGPRFESFAKFLDAAPAGKPWCFWFGSIETNEGRYGDIDGSPTKDVMIGQQATYPHLFDLAFGKRPREELYDCRKDPWQMDNLASNPDHLETLRKLSDRLTAHLKKTGDPRETTRQAPWDGWPYHGRNNWKIEP